METIRQRALPESDRKRLRRKNEKNFTNLSRTEQKRNLTLQNEYKIKNAKRNNLMSRQNLKKTTNNLAFRMLRCSCVLSSSFLRQFYRWDNNTFRHFQKSQTTKHCIFLSFLSFLTFGQKFQKVRPFVRSYRYENSSTTIKKPSKTLQAFSVSICHSKINCFCSFRANFFLFQCSSFWNV